MKPTYPNLELIEYIFKQKLMTDQEWLKKYENLKKKNKYVFLDFDVLMFPQTWGSTCTAFDVCPDGTPAIGGCAMTKAYTVVIKENLTDVYGVFVDGKPCYIVTDPTDIFFKDLNEQNMKPLSRAKKAY